MGLVGVFGDVVIFVVFFVAVIVHVFEFFDGFSGLESAEEFAGEGLRAQVFGAGHEGLRRERAVFGMVDDLVYILFLLIAGFVVARSGGSGGLFLWFGEDRGGDRQAVEEEAGAARVDLIGGDAAHDEGEGLLDGGAVFGDGEVELEGRERAVFGRGFAGVVVVVAEIFVAERGRAAAVSGGKDVAALVAWFGLLHGVSPCLSLKVFKRKDLSPDFGLRSG